MNCKSGRVTVFLKKTLSQTSFLSGQSLIDSYHRVIWIVPKADVIFRALSNI